MDFLYQWFTVLCTTGKILQWVGINWPPLWSSGQSSWLQIQKSSFDFQHYQNFREVVGLERGPLSLVSTIEKLLGRKSSSCSLETEITSVGVRHTDYTTPLYSKKLALTSPTSDSPSFGIVRSRTQATDFFWWKLIKEHNRLYILFSTLCFITDCVLVTHISFFRGLSRRCKNL
jgi:hypothetical protein